MKKSEIKVGGHYLAKVSGVVTTVRVDKIRDRDGFKRTETVYDVTNLRTGRTTTFRSAAKFRGLAKKDGSGPAHSRLGTGYYTDAQEQQISDAIDRRDAEEAAVDPTTAGTGTATPPVAPSASGSSEPSSPPSDIAPEGEQRPDPTPASGIARTSPVGSAGATGAGENCGRTTTERRIRLV